MDNKDLKSLIEAYYISVDTPDNEIATSSELSTVVNPITQTNSESDNTEERSQMINSNIQTLGKHLSEINQAILQGHQVEPWMEEKLAIATDSIVRIANAIQSR